MATRKAARFIRRGRKGVKEEEGGGEEEKGREGVGGGEGRAGTGAWQGQG